MLKLKKNGKQIFLSFLLLDDVTLTLFTHLRGVMHLFVSLCTVVLARISQSRAAADDRKSRREDSGGGGIAEIFKKYARNAMHATSSQSIPPKRWHWSELPKKCWSRLHTLCSVQVLLRTNSGSLYRRFYSERTMLINFITNGWTNAVEGKRFSYLGDDIIRTWNQKLATQLEQQSCDTNGGSSISYCVTRSNVKVLKQ